ncbi:PPOX class F420-dependent oxidoreductase [Streptomyces alkaliterrae]|uniref:PPOX class F420-dependent oxidoreductase n=1 Tax=Streptomyces alkaliterrae TaxID=2213162 RepID=A0A5P0YP04_9ACTN|nr:PPOX class F420-dependent oxidoreductase [Streptomyces alkaliterrae]MBB1253669.1 PPOX class F420-dependent oxidoreductase [Streptomyces alkaliterrae]MBB1260315.1 PPOX class F420-dependent oxidoreductase [Streptomyces alkaliterrae]MQS01978.1 PPOX class F420-dependent oxidoreductase [Streptomyces alkaliterrae]
MTTPSSGFDMFAGERRVRLTTYERDGRPVGEAAGIAVEGDRAFFRASRRTHKCERLHRYPEVEIATASMDGTPTGAPMKARARRLEGSAARHAARCLARRHPLMHGVLLPVGAVLTGDRAEHYELRLIGE